MKYNLSVFTRLLKLAERLPA